MKNVLIFLREDVVAPKGGPAGYVYNLISGLGNSDDVKISLLPAASTAGIKEKYEKLPLMLKKIYRVFGRYKDYIGISKPSNGVTCEFLNQYDAIHFHSCFTLYKNIDLLKEYKGKVILTSHCPKPPHLEMIEDMYSNFEKKLYGKRHLKVYENAAIAAFDRADYIIFPCPEAEEPYSNNWDKYESIKKKNYEKYIYISTGVMSCLEKVKLSRKEIRDKYNIPKNAFLISYVGRHNVVKGYDTLQKIASKFSEKDNIYFLVAGEESPLTRPSLSFWIEAGWTKDPYSIEAASDLFILPNKETYFDLVLLEVLSIGIKILATYTGGNKFFERFDSEIYYFNSVNDAVQQINYLKTISKSEMSVSKNRRLYLEEFTSNKFAENYMETLKKIV